MMAPLEARADWAPTDRPLNVNERWVYRLLRTLPTRVVPQAQIGPFTVDFLLPDLRVIVEADSLLYHLPPEHARRDRLRDRELQDAGFLVVHVWSDDLYRYGGEGKLLEHVLRRVLRARGVWLGRPDARRSSDRRVAE